MNPAESSRTDFLSKKNVPLSIGRHRMTRLLSLTLLAGLILVPSLASADEYVQGYYRSNGTYVQGYTRSSPNGTVTDNYSFKGNTNPYTGQTGTNAYQHDQTSPYYQGPNADGNVGHSNPYSSQRYPNH